MRPCDPEGRRCRTARGDFSAFRTLLAGLRPELTPQLEDLGGWGEVKLLTVKVNRLTDWCRERLLCIGDAAHAMSPVAGVGINLAIQDAVAAANLLAEPLRAGPPDLTALRRVQARRDWPTRATQRLQLALQRRVIAEALDPRTPPRPPLFLRAMAAVPWLRRIPARLIGLGLRPEHVMTPDCGNT